MRIEEFLALVEEARFRASSDSPIRGWGLNPPPVELGDWFDWVPTGPSYGCTSETCTHYSHDPIGAPAMWVPMDDVSILELGWDEDGAAEYGYFLVVRGEEARIIELTCPRHYWAHAREVDSAPDWALARLAELPEAR